MHMASEMKPNGYRFNSVLRYGCITALAKLLTVRCTLSSNGIIYNKKTNKFAVYFIRLSRSKSYSNTLMQNNKRAVILTSTKLLVIICWYFSRTLGSVIKFLQTITPLAVQCNLQRNITTTTVQMSCLLSIAVECATAGLN